MRNTENLPQVIDTELARLYDEDEKLSATLASAVNQAHYATERRPTYQGRKQVWMRSGPEAIELLRASTHRDAEQIIKAWDGARAAKAEVKIQMETLDRIYQQAPWTRYFPCLNTNGHIHSHLRCQTLYLDTRMGWTPGLSGKPVDEAVRELGPTLCSVCFPEAPVEWRQDRDPAKDEAKAAEKAKREEAKAAKNLTQDEEIKGYNGWMITTVAGAKQALRDAVEMANYSGMGDRHPWADAAEAAAETAAKVLLARGITQEELDTITARAIKKAKKEHGVR
jgi:hypothetical protein